MDQHLLDILDALGIQYQKFEHPPVFRCDEAELHCKDIPGVQDKNLFLRNKLGTQYYLVTLSAAKKLDIKKLTQLLGESKLSFASPDRLHHYLKLTPGSVSPFGLIYDAEQHIKVIVDQDIWNAQELQFHPNINTGTLVVSQADYRKFLESRGNEVKVLEL